MRQKRRGFLLVAAFACVYGLLAYGQDSPSLGDVARQARLRKQNKETQRKTGQASSTPRVITNEEIPEHSEPGRQAAASGGRDQQATDSPPSSGGAKMSAEEWKSQIQAKKEELGALQTNIDELSHSVQFAPGNCVAGCVQWNERQKQKQEEVERMRSQFETQKKRLQDMQESARQQGYGSSVYDP
jgi:hypothetical protein